MIKGLVGEVLGHSYSKIIHELLVKDCYTLYSLNKEQFDDFFKEKDFDFVNVTIPYKQDVIRYIDYISDEALEIGAVNLVINRDGKLYGYNTDYYGLRYIFESNNVEVLNKKCLILGTGGTSRTAYKVLSDLGAKTIYKSSRQKKENTLSYEEIYNYDFEIIINTTPVGMYPNINQRIIDLNKFSSLEFICDCVYNPLRTGLLIDAENKGIKNENGLKMLIIQAIKAHEIALNTKVEEEKIEKIYQHILSEIKNIVLIGMPGCGKTTIGLTLKDQLNMNYVDLDSYIENKYKMTIPKMFEKYGEAYFREKEAECTKEIALMKNTVISTGGGIIKNKYNIDMLKANGCIIYIDRMVESIYNVIKKTLESGTNQRPLFKDLVSLEKIYQERKELYSASADYVVKNNDTIDSVLEQIIKIIS